MTREAAKGPGSDEHDEQPEGGGLTPSGHPPYRGARNERFVYVRYPDGQAEFYDCQADSYELHNRIDADRRRLRAKIRRLKGFAKENCVPPIPAIAGAEAETSCRVPTRAPSQTSVNRCAGAQTTERCAGSSAARPRE